MRKCPLLLLSPPLVFQPPLFPLWFVAFKGCARAHTHTHRKRKNRISSTELTNTKWMVEDETRGGGEKRNGRTRKEGGFPGRNNEPERYYYYVYIYIYMWVWWVGVQRVWPTIVSSFEVATWLKDVEGEQWITDSSIRAVLFFFFFFFLFIARVYRNELCRIDSSRKYHSNMLNMEGR